MLVMQMRIAIERGKGLPSPSLHCSQPSEKPIKKFFNVCGVRSKTSIASAILKFIRLLFPVILWQDPLPGSIHYDVPAFGVYLQFIVFSRISATSRLVWVKEKLRHSMEA